VDILIFGNVFSKPEAALGCRLFQFVRPTTPPLVNAIHKLFQQEFLFQS